MKVFADRKTRREFVAEIRRTLERFDVGNQLDAEFLADQMQVLANLKMRLDKDNLPATDA